MRIYSKPMVTGHRGNQISCRGREMFVGSNLLLQWVPGSGKVVREGTKMSPGRVSPVVLQRGVICFYSLCISFILLLNHIRDTVFKLLYINVSSGSAYFRCPDEERFYLFEILAFRTNTKSLVISCCSLCF